MKNATPYIRRGISYIYLFNPVNPTLADQYFYAITLELLLAITTIDKKSIKDRTQKSYCNNERNCYRSIIKINHSKFPSRLKFNKRTGPITTDASPSKQVSGCAVAARTTGAIS